MSKTIPPYIHDSMMACSRKLFNAGVDGNPDYAIAVLRDALVTLQATLDQLVAHEKSNNGTD